jgi:hypothetical protein
MTFETETHISLKEYTVLSIKLLYRNNIIKIFLLLGIIDILFSILNQFNITNIHNDKLFSTGLFVISLNIFALIGTIVRAKKNYNSSKLLQKPRLYTFNEEKISYKSEGAEGNIEWGYVLKYRVIRNFILLYTSSLLAIFIKTNGLTAEQINFIKRKIVPNKK